MPDPTLPFEPAVDRQLAAPASAVQVAADVAAVAAKPRHLCFDLDGTLFQVGEYADFDDGQSLLKHSRPIPSAIRRLVQELDRGTTVSFVTARHERVAWATMKQLRDALGDRGGLDVFHRDFDPWELMAGVLYKLDALRYLQPDVYVGDLPMDQTAAAAAGVAFMPAEWWAKGHDLALLLNPDFKPATVAKRLLPTEVRIEDFDAPGGKYDCLTCGNRAVVAPGRLPAVCDACEKPGPWARSPNALPVEATSILGAPA